jgi:hypothetical protein
VPVSLDVVERLSSAWYDAPDGSCDDGCVRRAEDAGLDSDAEVVCDCDEVAAEVERDRLESLAESGGDW